MALKRLQKPSGLSLLAALLFCLVGLTTASAAKAENSDEALATIRDLISQQVAAFQNRDAEAAFALASPMVRSKFGSPQNFMMTVKTHFDYLYSTKSFSFGKHVEDDGFAFQEVEFVSAGDGSIHMILFKLIRFKDLGWRITAIQPVPIPDSKI